MNESKNTRVIIRTKNEINGDVKSDEMCLDNKSVKKLNTFIQKLSTPSEVKPKKEKTTKNVCAVCEHDKFKKIPI